MYERPARLILGLLLLASPAGASDIAAIGHPPGPATVTGSSRSYVVSFVTGLNSNPPSCFDASGRFVAFTSWATNLVPGQISGGQPPAVFVTDLVTGGTQVVSHTAASPVTTAHGSSSVPVISADGRWIAYISAANDLVAGQVSNGSTINVFLYDRVSGTNLLVSHAVSFPLNGGNRDSGTPEVSADGRFVTFLSQATNLIPGEVLGHDAAGFDLFLFDRNDGSITLVSHDAASPNRTGDGSTFWQELSRDGAFVAFASESTNLVPGQVDTNGAPDVFLFDRAAGTTAIVSRAAGDPVRTGDSVSQAPSISADGRFVAYESRADNLVPGFVDTNGLAFDVFLFDRVAGASTLVSHTPASPVTTSDGGSQQARVSADGGSVVYTSLSTLLVPTQNDPNGSLSDVFVFDRASGVNTIVSRAVGSPSQTGNAESKDPVISDDGSRIAFVSRATDLVGGLNDANSDWDVFLFDRNFGVSLLASRTTAGPTTSGNAASTGALIGADGNLVAFNSDATNLVPVDTNAQTDAFVFRPMGLGRASGFTPLTPCRLIDTRNPSGTGPPLPPASLKNFTIVGLCGIPADALGVSVNVTVTGALAAGSVDLYAAGLAVPPTALVSFKAGQTRANNALVSVAGSPPGVVTARNATAGTVHLIVDVNGYFR